MHELYLDQVVIFLIKYNEVPAELYLIQNKMTWSKYNECTYYLFQILQVLLNLLYFVSKYNAGIDFTQTTELLGSPSTS